MKTKIYKIFFILFLFFFATYYVLLPTPSFAQQITLSIAPSLLEVIIKPGKSILVAYSLQNLSDPTIITARVLPFIPKGNNGNLEILKEFSGPIRFSLNNADIAIDKPFFMRSRDQQQLLLNIRVPEGATEGDYYYTLLAETQPPPGIEGTSSSQAKTTIGANILITVTSTGETDVKGKIVLFEILPRYDINFFGKRHRLFDSNDKIPLMFSIENTGKNLVKPQGTITLRGNFGERAEYDILPQNILAESQRIVTATPSATFDKPASLVLSGFFIGAYSLSANVDFGEGSPRLFASSSFVALPIKFTIVLIAGIFITILIVKKIRNNEEEE